MTNALSPRILQPIDSNQNWSWDRPLPALGHTAVDFEKTCGSRSLEEI